MRRRSWLGRLTERPQEKWESAGWLWRAAFVLAGVFLVLELVLDEVSGRAQCERRRR